MFQGLRQGGMFYILDKCEDMKLKIGQVVSVSNPQPKANQFGASYQYALPNELFVDVKVKVGEDTIDFKQLNANMNIANSGNLVVSDSREAMSAEVEYSGQEHSGESVGDNDERTENNKRKTEIK